MSNAPVEAIVSSMAEGVLAVDSTGHVTFINPAARQLFRVATPPSSTPLLLEVIRHPELQQLVQRVLTTGQPEAQELTFFSPDERIFRVHVVSYHDEQDHRGALAVFSDFSEVRKLERLRRDFVANVSHELRTPVTAIQAAIETLQGGAADEAHERARFLSKIGAQADRLARLIDDLMALSQVESGGIEFQFETVSLPALFHDVANVLQPYATRQQVTVTLQLPHDLPPVRGDRERLHQVAMNLLDNAIKFNKPGGTVTVSATHDATHDAQHVTVAVADTGIGIPSEDILRIFERFYRVEKGRARPAQGGGGTGLGLAIVKHLVEAHAGTIRADSVPNRGSTFYVTLPRAA